MIISLTLNGEIYSVEPEQIYQGANNVNEIFIFAPLSANTAFEMEFTLPNGHITKPYILERIAPISSQLNAWKLVVDAPLTQYYGVIKYQFKGTINGTTTATGKGSFTITEGVDWVMPDIPDTSTYELLKNKIAQIEGDVINANTNSEEALQNSLEALAKAEEAKTTSEQALQGVADAVDKGNEAIELARGVDAKAESAVQNAEQANENATEALQLAEEAKAIASEKANSKVFDTYSQMIAWLRDVNNKGRLAVGSTLYIKDENVPDYWITAVYEDADTLGFYYGFEELESKLPDISNMVTTDTEQNITGAKNFTSIKKNGYDLEGKLTGIDFVSTDNMTTYADGKATIHGEFTTTTETDTTPNVISGSIVFGIKGSDTIVVEEDEEGSAIEIHLDKAVEDKIDQIESGLADKVGQSAINGLQQQIDQTNIDINEVRNIANTNTETLSAKADAIDLSNLDAKALKTPLSAPSEVKVVAINTNNAQTLIDLADLGTPLNYVTTDTEQTITAKKTITELATQLGGVIVSQNGYFHKIDGSIEVVDTANTFGNKDKYSVIESKERPQAVLPNRQNEDLAFLSDLDKMYPIGSIYMTTGVVSPASFLGGTWTRIKDKFLLAAGDIYSAGSEGGSADAVIVAHTHGIKMSNDGVGSNGYMQMTKGGAEYIQNVPIADTRFVDGTITTEDGVGKNMPPYLVVYMWERTE